jgi:serine/threonine-protein kinase RsbW
MIMPSRTKKFSITIPSSTLYLEKVEKLTKDVSTYAKLSSSVADDLSIVVTELVNNAIHHGNKENKEKKVYIDFIIKNAKIEIHIKDEGNGFNPADLKNPLEPENLLNESGRGIFLIKKLMDKLDFKFLDHGTEVIAVKYLK